MNVIFGNCISNPFLKFSRENKKKIHFSGGLGSILSLLVGFVLMNIGVSIGIVFMLMIVFSQCLFILSWTPSINLIVVILMSVGFAFSQSISNSQIRGLLKIKKLAFEINSHKNKT